MKTKIVMMLCLLLIWTAVISAVHAAELNTVQVDVTARAGEVAITGTVHAGAGQQVTALVTAPDGAVVYIGQTTAGTGGAFEFRFALMTPYLQGDYMLSVGNKTGQRLSQAFQFKSSPEGPEEEEEEGEEESPQYVDPTILLPQIDPIADQLARLAIRQASTGGDAQLFIAEARKIMSPLTLLPLGELSRNESDTAVTVTVSADVVKQTINKMNEMLGQLKKELAKHELEQWMDGIAGLIRLELSESGGKPLLVSFPEEAITSAAANGFGIQITALNVELTFRDTLLAGLKLSADEELKLAVNEIAEQEANRLIKEVQQREGEYRIFRAAGKLFDFHLSVVSGQSEVSAAPFPEPITVVLPLNLVSADKEKLGVYRLKPSGEWQYIGGSQEPTENRIRYATDTFSVYTTLEFSRLFSDTGVHWAHPDIEWLASQHLVDGVGGDRFAPDLLVTRAEYTAMMVRALRLELIKDKGSFRDVAASAWYADTVQTAAAAGLVSGYEGAFRPNDPITREELTKLVMEAHRKYGVNNGVLGQGISFVDEDQISPWARLYVSDAARLGFVRGIDEDRFAPQAYATRAQAVAIIRRLLAKLETNP
jgi:hypothetical protein